MRAYLAKSAARSLLTIFLILTFTFFLFHVIPGDPVRMLVRGPNITEEVIEKYMKLFGLDKPLHVQYFKFLIETVKGDLGVSFLYNPRPVSEVLLDRLYNTLILLIPGTIISIILGLLLGVLSAWKRGKKIDLTLQLFSMTFWAMPTFWLGMMFIVFLGRIFSAGGMLSAGMVYPNPLAYIKDILRHAFLPSITLILVMHGQYFIIIRNQLLEVLTENYVMTARAKGLSTYRILRYHAMPNAMLPTITIIALNFAFLVAGFITIETVFSWPGIGELIYKAVLFRDYPLLQGIMILLSTVIVTTNFISDLFYAYFDPRIRYGD